MKRDIDEATTDENKNRSDHDAEGQFERSEISAADQLPVNEGEASAQKGESKQGQESGRTLGRLGHSLILESFGGTKRKLRAELLLGLYLNSGTGLASVPTRT